MHPISRVLEPVRRRVRLMISRAVVQLVNDTTLLQECQVELMRGEIRSGVERFQDYGFTAVPLAGAEAICVFVGGSRDHGVVVRADDRRYRPKDLQAGEVMVYDQLGQQVHLRSDGTIRVVSTNEVVIDAPLVTLNGDLQVNGDIDATGHIIDVGGNTNNHSHP